MRALERFLILDCLVEIEALGSEEAMPARRAPRPDVGKFERHDLAAEQGDDPVNRSTECDFARTPAHRLWKADLLTQPRKDHGKHLARRLAAFQEPYADVITFVGGLLVQILDAKAVFFREARRRLLRRAVCLERSPPRRTQNRLVAVRLPLGQPPNAERETPRRTERLHLERVGAEPRLAEQLGRALFHRAERVRDERRGQLLGANLQQKLG